MNYPIRIPRNPSRAKRGQSRRRMLNELARELEKRINAELADKPPGSHLVLYGFLAADLGIPEVDVREAMSRVPGAGHNGITIRKAGE